MDSSLPTAECVAHCRFCGRHFATRNAHKNHRKQIELPLTGGEITPRKEMRCLAPGDWNALVEYDGPGICPDEGRVTVLFPDRAVMQQCLHGTAPANWVQPENHRYWDAHAVPVVIE